MEEAPELPSCPCAQGLPLRQTIPAFILLGPKGSGSDVSPEILLWIRY